MYKISNKEDLKNKKKRIIYRNIDYVILDKNLLKLKKKLKINLICLFKKTQD